MTPKGHRLGLTALCLLSAAASAAAQPAKGAAPMELSFPRVAVLAGDEAALPIYLVSDSVYTEPFQITLEFPTAQLSFVKVQSDYLADRAKWTLVARVEAHPEKNEVSVLRIDLTPDPTTFFPSGGVAHAHFLVDPSTEAGDILLSATMTAPLGAAPAPAPDMPKITVLSTLVFGCFFYMH